MDIVLLSGWSNAGKDFIADMFLNYGYTKLSFAGELKKIVAETYNIPLELTMTQEGKRTIHDKTGKSIRELLIQEARQIRERYGDGYFAKCVAITIQKQSSNKIILSDWRFPVELETLKSMFYKKDVKIYTVRVHRRGQYYSPIPDTYTENQLDFYSFDHQFENPGSYDASNSLSQQIENFFNTFNISYTIDKDTSCAAEIHGGINV